MIIVIAANDEKYIQSVNFILFIADIIKAHVKIIELINKDSVKKLVSSITKKDVTVEKKPIAEISSKEIKKIDAGF